MKDLIAKSIFWIVWSRVGLHGLSFLSTLVVVRILTPADYGLMALAGVWIYILSLIVELDLGSAIIQFPDLDETELNACFWLTTGLTLLGCLFLMVASPHIATWFSAPRLAEVLPVVALTLPLGGAKVVPNGLLKKHLEFDKVSKIEIVASVISIFIMLGMAWAGAGVWALVAGMLLPMVVQSMGSFWYVRWKPGIRVNGARVSQIVRYSLQTTGTTISWSMYVKVPTVILGKVYGETLLGIYSIAWEIATALTTKVARMMQQLALPVLAKQQDDINALRNSLLRSLRIIACVTLPLSIGTLLVAEDFVILALTKKWGAVVPILQMLSMYALYQSLCFLFSIVLKARYRVSFLLRYNLILLGCMSVAFLFGAHWLGVTGVALVWITVYPIMTIWIIREACKEIELGLVQLLRQISPATLATMGMTGVVLIVQWLLPGEDSGARAVRMGMAIFLGGLSYGAMLLLRGGQVSREVREVAGWILGFNEPIELKHLNFFWNRLVWRK